MIKRALSLWNRIAGTSAKSAAPTVQDDRRLWVRFAADLQGKVQVIKEQAGAKILAQVRDLSRGGVNIIVDQPLELGQMLSVELPANQGEVRTVLACVVRARPLKDKTWSVGCVFSLALNGDDLASFSPQNNPPASDNLRNRVRFSCDLTASYRIAGDIEGQSRAAEVLNISTHGIGLAVQPTLAAGSLVNVDLHDKSGRMVRTILACVVHTANRAAGDFVVGCNFIRELTEDELKSLL